MNNLHHVFVYGSLKKGFRNHDLLAGSYCLGTYETLDDMWSMVSFGKFPGVLLNPFKNKQKVSNIIGELYEVNDTVFKSLDELESNGEFYTRVLVSLKNCSVPAWMYILPKDKKTEYRRLPLVKKNMTNRSPYEWKQETF